MSFVDRLLGREITEAVVPDPQAVPERKGLEPLVPRGGTEGSSTAQSDAQTRRQHLEELHDAYVSCAVANVCVNTIARSVTAGGLVVTPDEKPADEYAAAEAQTQPEPDTVTRLRHLLRFTNPRENITQVLRGAVIDLVVFGDAFLEVTWELGEPVAIYSLDSVSMRVKADEHGQIEGYTQQVDGNRPPVEFKPHEVIHLSLDSPRGGLYGQSPTELAMLPIAAWLFTSACLKETMRRGDPIRAHIDLKKDDKAGVERFVEKYRVRNMGPKNIGEPIVTTNGGLVNELSQNKVLEFLTTLKDTRDMIISVYGVPPNKAQIVESGNLGGGTGEAQDKNWRVGTIIPLQTMILEALNYQIVQEGFGIEGWHTEFPEIDYRDSKVVEDIREQRNHNGAYTLNRWRRDIGEPPVEGGDDPVLVQRQAIVSWKDMGLYQQAQMLGLIGPSVGSPEDPLLGRADTARAWKQPGAAPAGSPTDTSAPEGTPPAEATMTAIREAFWRDYRARYRSGIQELSLSGASEPNGHAPDRD